MAAIIGDTGLVTSWAPDGGLPSGTNGVLIAGANAPMEFSINYESPSVDSTAFAASLYARTAIPNIRQWSGTIRGRLNPAKLGNTGFATFTGGYVTNIKSWTLNMQWPPQDSTAMNSGATVEARSFIPGILDWSGSYVCHIDHSTKIEPVGEDPATLTLVLANLATDLQFSGSAFTTQASPVVRVGQIAEVTYNFKGTGNLTSQAGSSPYSTSLFKDGAIERPATGALVLTAASGRTYSGDAFMSSMNITCAVDAMIEIEIGFQGSGALTIA